MGTYNLTDEEMYDELSDFLKGLEGDFTAESLVKAFNNIAIEEEWAERIQLK